MEDIMPTFDEETIRRLPDGSVDVAYYMALANHTRNEQLRGAVSAIFLVAGWMMTRVLKGWQGVRRRYRSSHI